MAAVEEHTVGATQMLCGSLDANDDEVEAKEDNRPRADSDLLEADHALGEVKQGSPSAHAVEAKYFDDDGNLEPSVQELESAVGKEVTTDYGTAKVEKVEEIAGEMFLIIKYEDGSEENIKYEELDDIKVSSKKSTSTTKSSSTKKASEPKAASPKTSPPPKKKIAKAAAKPTSTKTATAKVVKAAKPAKKTTPKVAKAAKPAKKTTVAVAAKPAKKMAAAKKVVAKKTTVKTTKKTGKR
jgi:hypothetical protein